MRRIIAWILAAVILSQGPPVPAFAATSSWRPTFLVSTEAFQTIDDADAAANLVLKFGENLNKTLTYNRTTERFEFNDDLWTSGAISGSGTVKFQNTTDSVTMFQILDANGGNPVLNVDTTNERVGIGTASPTYSLHLQDVDANTVLGVYDTAGTAKISVGYSDTASLDIFRNHWEQDIFVNKTQAAGKLRFQNASTDTMTIDALGNVGIGTTVPETKLEVPGIMSGTTVYATKSFSGAGLVDCDTAGTSKLLWDATTGRFSCGTDQTGGSGTPEVGTASFTGGVVRIGDLRYVKKQGDTMTGALTINLASGFLGLNILQMLSGAILHAEKTLTSSGAILSIGNLTTRGTASGKNLTFMGATSSYVLGNLGVGLTNPETKLEVLGTISGSILKSSGNLSVSGSILTELNTGGGVLYSNTGTLATTAKGASGQVLVARGTAAPEFKNPTGSMVWYVDSTLALGTRQGATVTMPFGMTATSVNLRVAGAPTGAALIVDINEGGTSLFGTRPQIAAGSVTGGGSASFSDTSIAAGSELSIDIDQIGSTFAGSGLTIQLNGIRKY